MVSGERATVTAFIQFKAKHFTRLSILIAGTCLTPVWPTQQSHGRRGGNRLRLSWLKDEKRYNSKKHLTL